MDTERNLSLFRELMLCDGIYSWTYGADGTLLSSNCPEEAVLTAAFDVVGCFGRMLAAYGVACGDDSRRIEFIRLATDGVVKCIADGIPVKGYFYWSLLDNFEWQMGYGMTFGLIAVDRSTMERKPKESLAYLGSL